MCCKKLKQILFPLNIFGKNKQCIAYDVPNDYSNISLDIFWIGERLGVSWTRFVRHGGRFTYEQKREMFENAVEEDEQIIDIRRTVNPQVGVWENKIYFNCTNVTYLKVNGEILING